jgi:hypothetical protein
LIKSSTLLKTFQTLAHSIAFSRAYDRAKLGGLSLTDLNRLELEFLFRMDFQLSVKPDEYSQLVSRLRSLAESRSMFCCTSAMSAFKIFGD